MTTNYSDLCRLCAKKNDFSKDLLDKNNKNMLDLVHQFIQISVTENDNLPTKVCLDCEEKMVSFQLYILQCYKVQDYLNEVCFDQKSNVEEDQFRINGIKSEVKNELVADDIFNEIQEDSVTEFGGDDYQNDACNDMASSDNDDITIASLKERTSRQRHDITEDSVAELNRILNKPNLDISDIVKLECTYCVMQFKSWADICSHYAETHDTTPIVHCLCGYTVDSTSTLNKHFTWHKKINNEMRLFNKIDGDLDDVNIHNKGIQEDSVTEFGGDDYQNNACNDMASSDNDDITIASLKERTTRQRHDIIALTSLQPLKEENELTEEEKAQFNKIIENPTFKVTDIIKLQCRFCEKSFKSWKLLSSHYTDIHRSSPRATCLCGYIIRSTITLHNHVAYHKKKTHKNVSKTKVLKNKKYYREQQAKMTCRVKDYIQFTCVSCEKEYSSWYKLKSHTERIHKLAPVVICMTCGLAIKSKSSMYKHVQDHKNPTEFSCDQCSLRAKSLEALNKHKLRHVPKTERKFECQKCDKVFSYKEALKSHEKSHIPIEERKVYQCDKCELRFASRSAVSSHKRTVHEKLKSYVCDNCGYACGTGGELRQHVAIHSDDRPFVCKTCSKRFKTYANLKTHEDTHGETSYECFICNRVLNSRRTLRKHLLVHDDKCRHTCTYCNKAFKRRQTLKVHMFTHTGDKPLTCKWCDERFSYASTLRSHRLRCHPDRMAANDARAARAADTFHYSIVVQKPYVKDDCAAISVTTNES